MKDILIIFFTTATLIGLVRSWSQAYKIAYYETWIERLRDEANIPIGTSYESVKNDFWKFLK